MGKFNYKGKPWPKKYAGPNYEPPLKVEREADPRPPIRRRILRQQVGLTKRYLELLSYPNAKRRKNLYAKIQALGEQKDAAR